MMEHFEFGATPEGQANIFKGEFLGKSRSTATIVWFLLNTFLLRKDLSPGI